ncbi:hypothetical protein [Fructobacillus fructosus]|uniref:hypothetical protein n=1 Tax=Fructobacillus fructosus TaxID=1631 RepID=UPI001658B432|nr:hypothetical protein [Fructobacillus fructosus]MBC9119211.1 hypothetical protein [Fructobacillus fructosus]MBD9366409.1 hypothetical protein [Leuconostoc mesenteroides]
MSDILHSKKFEKFIVRQRTGQNVYKFENGYGASVVCHIGTYGFENGLCEIAVFKFDGNGCGVICYRTPITDDVIGYANTEKRDEVLKKIKELEE